MLQIIFSSLLTARYPHEVGITGMGVAHVIDLSAENPSKEKELIELWNKWADHMKIKR
jgi:hypothetical protein